MDWDGKGELNSIVQRTAGMALKGILNSICYFIYGAFAETLSIFKAITEEDLEEEILTRSM